MPEHDLSLLIDAAEQAGTRAMGYFRADPKAWEKSGGAGPVSEADLDVNTYLHDRLRDARPDYGWLSEETDDDPTRQGHDTVFIVDPIDGTRAFLAQEPSWAVVIAVAQAGQVKSAVVHLPAKRQTYAARLGGGTTLNGQRISVSQHTDAENAHVLAAKPTFNAALWPGGVPQLRRSFRPALAYRMALVAEGRFDAMITLRPSWEWDIAAGSLLVAEAGGCVTDRHGAPLRFNGAPPQVDGVIAAGNCHMSFLDRLTNPRLNP